MKEILMTEKDMVFLLSFRDLNYLPTGKILQALELSIINVYLDGLFSNKFFFLLTPTQSNLSSQSNYFEFLKLYLISTVSAN